MDKYLSLSLSLPLFISTSSPYSPVTSHPLLLSKTNTRIIAYSSSSTEQRINELTTLINQPQISDYLFTILGTTLSIPLATKVPKQYSKYLPLLVLGSIGGLTDYFLSRSRIQICLDELHLLQQKQTVEATKNINKETLE